MTIRPGQIWQEKDKRAIRFVKIEFVCLGDRRVRIKSCLKNGEHPKGARSTETDVARFADGRDFKLVRDA